MFFASLTALPALLILGLIRRFAVNVPYWDDWELVPLIVKLHQGSLTFYDFWMQHNEHRLIFPRLLMLGLVRWSGWNVVNEIYASWFLTLLTGLVLWRLATRTLPAAHTGLATQLLLPFALLIFSPVQGENWLWGWQVSWFLVGFCVVLAIWALTCWAGQWLGLVIALLASIVATYSLASGQIIWLLGLFSLLVQWRIWRWRMIAIWGIAATLCIGAYFYAYHSPPGHPSVFFALQHPVLFVIYLLAYLGSPLGSWSGLPSLVSAGYGLAGLLGLGLALFWLWLSRSVSLAPIGVWVQIAAFSLLCATLTAIGRAGFGIEQALSSRYTTVALYFWLGFIVIGSIALREYFAQLARRGQQITLVVIAALSALIGLGYLQSLLHGLIELETLNVQLLTGLAYVVQPATAPDPMLALLYPAPPVVRQRARALQELNEGPFNPRFGSENNRALFQNVGDLSASASYQSRLYPTARIILTRGEASTVQVADGVISFTNSGAEGVSFYVDAGEMRDGSWLGLPSFPPHVVDVQSKAALTATIYWNTGAGLNEAEKSTFYGLVDVDGWQHFRSALWSPLDGFRVDLRYPTAVTISDSLRIVVYDRRWP